MSTIVHAATEKWVIAADFVRISHSDRGDRRATPGRSGAEPVLVSLRSLPGEPVDWDRVRQIRSPALGFH